MSINTPRLRALGESFATLRSDVLADARDLLRQSADALAAGRVPLSIALLKQAVDAPKRARAKIAAWIAAYDARPGNVAGDGQALIVQGLAAYGAGQSSPLTIAEINANLVALENGAVTLASHVQNDGWTWAQVAAAMATALVEPAVEKIELHDLPIPQGYITVWGEPY